MSGFNIILAADRTMGIGRKGELPWHLPGDMAAFKRLTTGDAASDMLNAVIMGRKTWNSIPERFRPLPGRINIVITSQADLPVPEPVRLANGLDDALSQAGDAGEVFVIGGGAVYREAFVHPQCQAIYLTRVEAELACDTYAPSLPEGFMLDAVSEEHRDNDLRYRFEVYHRARGSQNV